MTRWHPSDHINQSICRKIALRRRAMGLSQGDIASALGISYQQVQKYETGQGTISAAKLWHLAKLFEVSVAWFYEDM